MLPSRDSQTSSQANRSVVRRDAPQAARSGQLMLVRRFDEHARPAHVYHVGKRARQLGVACDGHAIAPRPLTCHKET